jgi:hypothetical protein
MDKPIYFFGTSPSNPWAILAMWLPLAASHKIQEN